jgi:hypothetical protein
VGLSDNEDLERGREPLTRLAGVRMSPGASRMSRVETNKLVACDRPLRVGSGFCDPPEAKANSDLTSTGPSCFRRAVNQQKSGQANDKEQQQAAECSGNDLQGFALPERE